jgi:hypothetical protein
MNYKLYQGLQFRESTIIPLIMVFKETIVIGTCVINHNFIVILLTLSDLEQELSYQSIMQRTSELYNFDCFQRQEKIRSELQNRLCL